MKQNQSKFSLSIKYKDKIIQDHERDHVNTVLEEMKENEGTIQYVENETDEQ